MEESSRNNPAPSDWLAQERSKMEAAKARALEAVKVYLEVARAPQLLDHAKELVGLIDSAQYRDPFMRETRYLREDHNVKTLTEIYNKLEASFNEGRKTMERGLSAKVTEDDIDFKFAVDLPEYTDFGDKIKGLGYFQKLPSLERSGKELGKGKKKFIRRHMRSKVPKRSF